MRIFEFVRSMLPSFKRNEVTEQLRLLRDDLVNQTLPPFVTAVDDFRGNQFHSSAAADYEKAFRTGTNTGFRGEWLEVTLQVLQTLQANLDVIETLVDKNYGPEVVVAGLTYKKAQILQYIAVASFVSDYSRQNLLYILAAEGNLKAKTLDGGKERPAPELRWLQANQLAYFRALNSVSVKDKQLADLLEAIPDVVISEDNVEVVEQTVGKVKLDPLQFGIIPIGMNPFHFIGVRWANRQVVKYQRAKEEKRALEFRLEQLRSQRKGVEDPKLDKSIAYYEDQVNLLAAKLAKMEA